MHHPRPSRLAAFSYTGHHRYSLTICTRRGTVCLASALLAEPLLVQLRHDASQHHFAILAYCFMPHHLHLVLEGLSEVADLRRFVARWKQGTGYWYKQKYQQTLWMSGYYDRILRDGESTLDAVGYAMSNPIRARLASRIGEYPFAGSDLFSMQELQEVLERTTGP